MEESCPSREQNMMDGFRLSTVPSRVVIQGGLNHASLVVFPIRAMAMYYPAHLQAAPMLLSPWQPGQQGWESLGQPGPGCCAQPLCLPHVMFPCCAPRAMSLGSIFAAIKQHFHWGKLHFNSKRRGLLKAAAGPVWRQALLFFLSSICTPYASTAEKLTWKFFKKETNI